MNITMRRAALATLRRQPFRALAAPLAQSSIRFGNRLKSGLAGSQPLMNPNREEQGELPILLELLGPSGVGKTTLGSAMLADKALRTLLRPHGGLTPSAVALQEVPSGTWGTAAHRNDNEYRELLQLKLEHILRRSMSVSDLNRLLGFHVGVLQQDLLLSSRQRTTVILRDDGLLHNFGAEFDAALQRASPVQSLFSNRVVIHLRAPDYLIAERAIERQLRGGARPQYVGLTPEEAEPIVSAASVRIRRLAEHLSNLGVPSLTVDAAAPPQENLAIIRGFLPGAVAARRRSVPT